MTYCSAGKSEVVEQGNYLKFTLCDDTPSIPKGSDWTPRPLRDLLLETYERELVEVCLTLPT